MAVSRLDSIMQSLSSVYNQKDVNLDSIQVILCCDFKENELEKIKVLESKINLLHKTFKTYIIKNTRTKAHSGTGAWNTAAFYIMQNFIQENKLDSINQTFLAFLDDDDTWEDIYLREHIKVLESKKGNIGLVASGIRFHKINEINEYFPSANMLNEGNVFVRNPHIQGSNLFINLNAFLSSGSFDESLKSTTDRDLIMRYLQSCKVNNFKTYFINKILVNYNAINTNRVTTNKDSKTQGLNIFYYKYFDLFSPTLQRQSLKRAKDLFDYNLDSKQNIESSIKLKKNSINAKINLLLCFASYEFNNIKECLNSFLDLKPQKSKYIKDYRICILTNINLLQETKSFLESLSLKAHIKSINNKVNIAKSRTILQRFSKKMGDRFYKNDYVTWIIDDDLRFKGYYKNRFYKIDYFYFIAKYYKSDISCLLGGVTNEPPLPFFSTLRVQLLDFYYKLKGFKSINTQDIESKEYYYDLSSKDFCFLEYPFYSQNSISHIINLLNKGKVATRKITLNPQNVGILKQDSIHRGGNTIIYDNKMLELKNITFDYAKYNRRSDFNWAILQTYVFKKTIKEINLPLFHKRTYLDSKIDLEKLESDLYAMVLYRVFLELVKSVVNKKILNFNECENIFNNEIIKLKAKILSNIYRIKTLDLCLKEITKDSKNYITLSQKITKYITYLENFIFKKHSLHSSLYKKMLKVLNYLNKI